MSASYQDLVLFIRDFEACCLPKAQWTHAAHLSAGFWYLHKHEPAEALAIIRERIKRHNESVGTANTDSSGYHETITRLYMLGIARHRALHATLPFDESLTSLLASPLAQSAWPLQFFTKERLFSVEARRSWIEPDLAPAP